MNLKNVLLVIAGAALGAALSAGVLTAGANGKPVDDTAATLKKLVEQNEKILGGQEAMMKELAAIKADTQFIKATARQ